jgi:hypothetical protein
MERDKQQQTEASANLRLVQERVNLREYAGDSEDDQLARDQANEYITDCDRRLTGRVGREEEKRSNK